MDEELIARLRKVLSSRARISRSVNASNITTFKLGGDLSCLIQPASLDDFASLVETLKRFDYPWRILGAGSNVLIRDVGCCDVVVSLGREFSNWCYLPESISDRELMSLITVLSSEDRHSQFVGEHVKDRGFQRIFVLGATPLMGLSRLMSQQGLSGLEFAAGIPASVGGAVKMNAGAHGGSMSQVVRRVVFINNEGGLSIYENSALRFSYRSSEIGNRDIVIGVELELIKKNTAQVMAKREQSFRSRRQTQPLRYPSAGSIFLNPAYSGNCDLIDDGLAGRSCLSAGSLLEQAGLKGARLGGVEYSSIHANWIIKVGESAHAHEVLTLIEEGRRRVLEKFGISLVTELCVW